MVKSQTGFTLIELMIIVAIVGILVAIAYPSYQESVRKTKRIDAQTEMIKVASNIQRFRIANFTLIKPDGTPIDLNDIGQSAEIPIGSNPLYDLELTNVTAGTWTLTATPRSTQAGNGHIVLNHRDQRCWTHGSDNGGNACVPSATTNWDGR